MGSKTFDGVWFTSYSRDHVPAHVHASYAETLVVVDLLPGGGVAKSNWKDAVQPMDAPASDVRRILRVARANEVAVREPWEKAHGIDA